MGNKDLQLRLYRSLRQLCSEASLKALCRAAAATGAELYLVGGFIRDAALGRRPQDLDLLTDNVAAVSSAAADIGFRVLTIDRRYQCVRLLARSDWSLKFKFIDVVPLREDLTSDLRHRDFTINAIALDLIGWQRRGSVTIHDPLGGLYDLQAGILRICSQVSFKLDPLRTLRAYRFAALYNCRIDPETRCTLLEELPRLRRVAPERVRDEFFAILALADAGTWLRQMDVDGAMVAIIPELAPLRGLEQGPPHHLDVWQHSLRTVVELEELLRDPGCLLGEMADQAGGILEASLAGGRNRSAVLKLAALLHDIGKPECRLEAGGRTSFYRHEIHGQHLAATVCRRLMLSRKETEFVVTLVRHHLWPLHLSRLRVVSSRALARFFRQGPEVFLPLLLLFGADHLATHQGDRTQILNAIAPKVKDWLRRYRGCLERRLQEPRLVDGRDLLASLDITPGPLLGRLLAELENLQVAGQVKDRQEALAAAARLLRQWRQGSPKQPGADS